VINIFGYSGDPALFWTILGAVIGIAAILIALWLNKKQDKKLSGIETTAKEAERHAREANENIKNVEKHLGIPLYVDGLPEAEPLVFDPFFAGTKLMADYKWVDAIKAFQGALKQATGSQMAALYNLIGICYFTTGKLNEALENYELCLKLARQFRDKEGEAVALGNIGLIYQVKGDLDKALEYHGAALKIARDIGNRDGEANQLGNIGLIYRVKGDLDKALEYLEEALKIFKAIGAPREIEITENNIRSIKKR